MTSPTPANRLIDETSPYLLQHAYNPVEWYPWGPEALERARSEDRPIFLSIGYSACHWCHVMERECFEDPAIAAVMNELYVNIKVDREERPDLDEIYMTACQVLTHSGGWPLSVWLTPDGRPFFAGTYFPPEGRWGRPGFPEVLRRMHGLYAGSRDRLEAQADELARLVAANAGLHEGEAGADAAQLDALFEAQRQRYDTRHGGFGGAPKFPPSFALESLLRRREARPEDAEACERMLRGTLDGMAQGGMFDHLGGGFHRYSTDERWLVPHFEKMLYDNALLVPVYLRAAEVLDEARYARVAAETLEWCLREMIDPEGGVYSTQDADSEGVEGKFFVWTPEQLSEVLEDPEDARAAAAFFGVTERGNWHEMPGVTVLHTPRPAAEVAAVLGLDEAALEERLARARKTLLAARAERVPPATDTKVLTAWNGLMLTALAAGGEALDEPRYLDAARGAARSCWTTLRGPGGLLRTWRQGKAHLRAYLEDYAYLTQGLLDLFVATAELEWLRHARTLAEEMLAGFADEEGGGFFFTHHDHEQLLARTKNPVDNATPSANSVAVKALLRLAHLGESGAEREVAEATLAAFGPGLRKHPMAFQNMLCALDQNQRPPAELVVVGPPGAPETAALWAAGRKAAAHDTVRLQVDPARPDLEELTRAVPWLEGKAMQQGRPTAYACRGGACERPVHEPEELVAALTTSV